MPKLKNQSKGKIKMPSVKPLAPPTGEPASKDTPKPEVKAPPQLNIEAEVKRKTEDYNKGVKDGIEIAKQLEFIKRGSFNAGVRHMIKMAEDSLAKSLGLNSRQELADHGDLIPSWWIASYFSPGVWYDELQASSEVKQ